MNIALDTNILRNDFQLRSSEFKVILDYLRKTNGKVILPEVVYDEIVYNHKKELEARASKMENAIKHLNLAVTETEYKLSVPKLDIQLQSLLFIKHLKETLQLKDDQVIPSKNEYLPKVLERAIKNIRPFRGHDKGFRDSIIWLTLKDYCLTLPENRLYS